MIDKILVYSSNFQKKIDHCFQAIDKINSGRGLWEETGVNPETCSYQYWG
jgi:hypothetical protein